MMQTKSIKLGGANLKTSPALFFCMLNADKAVMIPPVPQSRSHMSLLSHAGVHGTGQSIV